EALLDTIQTNLKLLANERGDREALWNIQKAAHTFKGAAGVVGLHKLSGIAHRIEDFLDYLSSQEKGSNVQVVDVLVNATECLQSLSNGDDSQRVGTRIEKLEGEFADTLRAISTNALSNISHDTPLPPDAIAKSDVPLPQAPARPARSPVVRISMERLDGLVHIIRDLVSSRTIFEARIDELAAQIQESCNNTLRLQAATRKIKKGDSSSYRSEPANGGGPPAVLDQTTYELTETARDASLINSSLKNIKTGFEDVFVQQRALIERIQGRLIRLRNVEFGTIFTRLQRAVRMTCEEEGKNAEIEIENGALEVDTQIVDQLIEPLMHLLKNAVVHGIEPPEIRRMLGKPEVGRIVVRVGTDGPNILLSVADDGSGIAYQTLVEKAVVSGRISREEAERMPQSQIRELVFLPGLTTAEKLNLNAGRGVGMSIVRESVAAAQGTVTFETLPQKGTTFKIRIPLPFADFCFSESTKDQRMDNPAVHELTVLVVDDSPSVRLMTSRVLQDAGWHVLTAGNGIDALEKLAEMDPLPNIILSDIEMPQMGGYEFLAALSEDPALKTIPVIVISSRVGSENRDQALAAGAIEYFTKPYNERDVIEFLDRFARSESLVPAS
nr:response regulator [Blastocatellia bacterium]